MKNRIVTVSVGLFVVLSGITFGAELRERIPLDKGWQSAKTNQGQIFDRIPSSQVKWQDHKIEGMPLPAGRNDVYQGWYRCRVTVPANFQSGTVWLRMENWLAAKTACWVNGRRLEKEYWTGFLPAEWRVDEFLKPGSENEIVLCFWSLDWAKVALKDKAITKESEAGREFTFLVSNAKAAGNIRYLVPTAYGNGDATLCYVGPTGPVVLERRGKTFINNILTQPGIEGPKLTVKTDIYRYDKTAKELTLRYEVYDGNRLIARKESPWQAGRGDTFPCPGAELWWPQAPKLYRLEVTLCEGGTAIDKQIVRIGFREVKTQGRKVLLNGVVYHPFGTSSMAIDMVYVMGSLQKGDGCEVFWHATKENIRKMLRLLKSQNIRMIRMGQAVYPEAYFDAADEEGFLVMAESALNNSCCWLGIEIDEFWQHWRENMLGLVRRSGNHPSIVSWSLGNEVGHGGRGKIAYPKMAKVVKEIKKLDPTRLISCSGDGDVGGCADVVNIHYPQCGPGGSLFPGQDFPRSAFWLGRVDVWPNYYDVADQKLKEKPFFIGEWDTLFGHPPQTFACAFGDEAFVGGCPGSGPEQAFLQNQILHGRVIRQFIEGYRYNGVSYPSPWCMFPYMAGMYPQRNISLIAEAYAPELVMLMPQPECFFSEGRISTTAVIFNDTLTGKEYVGIFRLEVGNKVAGGNWNLWYNVTPHGRVIESFGKIPPGGKVERKLRFQLPPVDSPTPVRLYVIVNGDSATVARRTYEWTAYPRSGPVEPKYQTETVGLFDPQGGLSKALADFGLKHIRLTPKFDKLSDCRAVLIAENSLAIIPSDRLSALKDFVRRGGRMICLQQDNYPNLLPENVVLPGAGVQNTYNFIRAENHPILKDITNDQLCLWGKDLLVSRAPLHKTDLEGIRYLVDCGVSGFGGLSVTSLAEVRQGDGVFLLCQMLIEKNVGASPGARRILMNMIRYALDFDKDQPQAVPVTVLSKDAGQWQQRFKEAKVTPGRGMENKNPATVFWCDDAESLNDQVVNQVKTGGTLVLYNLDLKQLAAVNKWFGLSVAFRQRPEVNKWWFSNKTHQTNLLDGVSNQDMFFIASELVVGAVFEKIENVLRYPIDIGSQGGLVPACEPVGLCQIVIGKGRLVFCQLNCFDSTNYKKEGRRIFLQLLYNLGLRPESSAPTLEKVVNYYPIDIRKQANMAFRDDQTNDGKGGWFDQAQNDLREFPLDQKVFAGATFDIIDPAKNGGKSCIVLKSGHTPTMPAEVTGVRVEQKANAFCALIGVSWGPLPPGTEIGKIVLHFDDGTTGALPIQYGLHVTEWWSGPELLEKAKPGWVGSNPVQSPIVIYKPRWENPSPGKKIMTMDLISNNAKCPLGIIAVTAETQ